MWIQIDRGEIDVVPGYPKEDGFDCTEVNNKRSARQVPQKWIADKTLVDDNAF